MHVAWPDHAWNAGAAIGTRESDYQRIKALAAEHVDIVVIDSAQGDSTFQADMIR